MEDSIMKSSLVKHDFNVDFEPFFNDWWNSYFARNDLVLRGKNNYPKTDVYTTKNEVVLELAVPGLTRDNLKVEYSDGMLTVSGDKREAVQGTNHRKELHRSSFKRSWSLNEVHDVDNISSTLENGILKVIVPFKEVKRSEVLKIEVK